MKRLLFIENYIILCCYLQRICKSIIYTFTVFEIYLNLNTLVLGYEWMNTKELGLPFEYQQFPEYFEAVEFDSTTDVKNGIIERLLKEQAISTVLDMTCGTGSQVFYLAQRGYQVTGSDFSPQLIKIARKKAQTMNLEISFIDGDMRTLYVNTFDAVITIFNAIGHLSKDDFAQAIRNISRNLKQDGIYVFDILNAAVMTDELIPTLSYYVHKQVIDTQVHVVQCSTFDSANNCLTSYNSLMFQKGAQKPEQHTNICSLQLYTAQELDTLLYDNGFKVLKRSTFESESFKEDQSLSIITVAQKIF